MGSKGEKVSSGSNSECVRVVVRARPLSGKEQSDGRKRIVEMDVDAGQVKVSVCTRTRACVQRYAQTLEQRHTSEHAHCCLLFTRFEVAQSLLCSMRSSVHACKLGIYPAVLADVV